MPMTSTESLAHEKIREAVDVTREERFEEALGLFEEHLPALTAGTLTDKRVAAGAMSFYGLCVAKVRRRYADGVKYCNISIRSNMFEPEHRYNLAVIFLERGDRGNAVETLNAGLRLRPNHTRINDVFDEIGRRSPPVVSFLSRNNPINIWLGKKIHPPGKD